MTDSHGHHGDHHGPTVNTYVLVFGVLCCVTLVSFLVNLMLGQGNYLGASIILAVAVLKASLVAMYFMHLKFDFDRVYFILIPIMILTVMMMIVLLPDIVVDWHVLPDMTVGMPE